MADLTLLIKERIILEGTERGTDYNLTLSDIGYIDNRILNAPSGSDTTIFALADANAEGTFVTSSLKYARISNYSTTATVNLKVSSSTEELNFNVAAKGTFMLSTSEITGSIADFTYDDIASISVSPSGSNAKIEYFIATT